MSLFGKNIKKIRSLQGLSQQAFADEFDLKRGTLGAYEEGRSEPKLETVIKIANHFSISIDDMLTKELTVNRLVKFKADFNIDAVPQVVEYNKIVFVSKAQRENFKSNYEKDDFLKGLPSIQIPIESNENFCAFQLLESDLNFNPGQFTIKDIIVGEKTPIEFLLGEADGISLFCLHKANFKFCSYNTSDFKFYYFNTFLPTIEIEGLWKIKYVIGPYNSDNLLEKRVLRLEEKMDSLLQSKLK